MKANPAHYLPELADSVFGQVSIRNVLNMVTALDYTEEYDEMTPGSVHLEYFDWVYGGFFALLIDPAVSDEPRGVRDIATIPPGRWRRYRCHVSVSIAKCSVIGWLVERITSAPLVILSGRISGRRWEPSMTVCSQQMCLSHPSHRRLQFHFTRRGTFGLMALNDGCLGQTQIAPESWIKDTYDVRDEDRAAGPPASMRFT